MDKKLSVKDLLGNGVLLEANRLFFHPLGLALAVDYDEQREDQGVRLYVLDARDDPEGFIYGDEIFADGEEIRRKRANFAKLRHAKEAARLAKFGWVIQPLPPRASGEDDAS